MYEGKKYILIICFISLIFTSCHPNPKYNTYKVKIQKTKNEIPLRTKLSNKYRYSIPKSWGENIQGIKTRLDTKDKVIALTFDACGGKHGSKYDKDLIDYLIKEKIPATLFINARWIDANQDTFIKLSKNTLFEIENHGFSHKPLSVNGKSIYNISGTKNVDEVLNEILYNQEKIYKLTGRKPKFFRSGTAYYDDIAIKIVNETGLAAVNFDILGDAGATFSKSQVNKSCLKSKPGSIVILHMNQPNGDTAEGIMMCIPKLKSLGYKFVKLEDYKLK